MNFEIKDEFFDIFEFPFQVFPVTMAAQVQVQPVPKKEFAEPMLPKSNCLPTAVAVMELSPMECKIMLSSNRERARVKLKKHQKIMLS